MCTCDCPGRQDGRCPEGGGREGRPLCIPHLQLRPRPRPVTPPLAGATDSASDCRGHMSLPWLLIESKSRQPAYLCCVAEPSPGCPALCPDAISPRSRHHTAGGRLAQDRSLHWKETHKRGFYKRVGGVCRATLLFFPSTTRNLSFWKNQM